MSAGPRFLHLTLGETHWQVVAEHREQLLGPQGLPLDEWLGAGHARVVKHGPHRTVYRVTLGPLDFYLKHYRLRDTRAWLRELVRPSKARMEYDRAVAVAARGVLTFTPLAVGEHRPGRGPAESFLVTRTLADVEPLSLFLETTLPGLAAARQTRLRQALAVRLGELLAQLHDAGICHHDLHAGNLLLHLGPDDRPTLYLIDLHAVHLRGPLDWAASRANLIMLNRWFILRASRSDRRRCWEAYAAARRQYGRGHPAPTSGGLLAAATVSELARDLERRTWTSNLQFWRNRDRRCRHTNRYYKRVRTESVVGHVVRDLDPAVFAPLLADPDEPFRRPGVTLLKDSRSSTVAEFDLLVDGTPRRVIYKRFRVTAWSDPWAALCRPTGALRSWVFGHGLRERCLPTPRPLAVCHRCRHGLLREGYLLMEKVPGAVDLHRFVAAVASRAPAERHRLVRLVIERVAALVRELHRRHLAHRDLKASNILVTLPARPPDAALALWLIDLVGISRHQRLPRRRRVQNLARLHASFHHNSALTRTDKLRFLRTYLQWGLLGREGWKRWWREVEEATRAKVARNARSGRPLA